MNNISKFTAGVLAFAVLGVTATSCSENYWNEHELDGFDVPGFTDKKSVSYTLTAADYANLAKNSANKTLAEAAGLSKELANVGTQGYFTADITAREYMPAYLTDPAFCYFTLSNGSALNITYKVGKPLPESVSKVTEAFQFKVSMQDYMDVWESEDNYIQAFAPSHTAASVLPNLLVDYFPEAVEGDFAVVNYNQADNDPVFSTPDEPVKPGFALSNVIASLGSDENTEINGLVMATGTQGIIVADNSGAIFAYKPTDYSTLKIGDEITLAGTTAEHNKSLQIAAGSTFTASGNRAVTYPTPTVLDGAALDAEIARTDFPIAKYVQYTGVAAISEKNINVKVDGAATAQGSIYGFDDALKAMFTDGETVTVEGYLINIAGGKYCNTIVTKLNGKDVFAQAAAKAPARAPQVATKNLNAVYQFTGTKWVLATGFTALSHADYQAMGRKYDNLEDDQPAQYIPTFVKTNYPYAQEGDTRYIVYAFYTSDKTTIGCMPFAYIKGEWTVDNGVREETSQFVRSNGKWMYDPNVEITLPAGKSQPLSTLYYQTCVDYVKDNVPDGEKYVTKYGTNEYYSGTSAYQGNVDLRASAAKAQYPAVYDDMTNEEVVALEKTRFESEVFPAALSIIHADVAPVAGVDVVYTFNFYAYDGTDTTPYKIRYKVVGKGEFEFMDCTWNKKADKEEE